MVFNNYLYINDVEGVASLKLPWDKLQNKKILISGAGFICSFIADVIMYRNKKFYSNSEIFIIARDQQKAQKKFNDYFNHPLFHFIKHDINHPLDLNIDFDYIIHGASNTHPIIYANDPIGTITTNVFGVYNLLLNAKSEKTKFVLLSSVEVYGENNDTIDHFSEVDFGYINCNTLRAGYPESKRISEALCQAFIAQRNINASIVRLCRVYGPSEDSDSKASAQFIRNGINNENIVLKSPGKQQFSYIYLSDAASALFYILFYGNNGEAYNVADEASNTTLYNFASLVAKQCKTQIIFDLPKENETKGFSVVTKALINPDKLKKLGWYAVTSLEQGIEKTIEILKH